MRNKTNPAHDYFNFDPDDKFSHCKLCNKKTANDHGGNKLNHLKSFHVEKYTKCLNIKAIPINRKRKLNENPNHFPKKCISVALSLEDSTPFAMMDDSGFRRIIDPILAAFPNSAAINSKNVITGNHQLAQRYVEKITNEVSNKLIKVDIATKQNRSMLGVNVQTIQDSKLILRTLGIKEMLFSHTGAYIKELTVEILNKYNIKISQIFTRTSDNGSNVVKFVEYVGADQENEFLKEAGMVYVNIIFLSGFFHNNICRGY